MNILDAHSAVDHGFASSVDSSGAFMSPENGLACKVCRGLMTLLGEMRMCLAGLRWHASVTQGACRALESAPVAQPIVVAKRKGKKTQTVTPNSFEAASEQIVVDTAHEETFQVLSVFFLTGECCFRTVSVFVLREGIDDCLCPIRSW